MDMSQGLEQLQGITGGNEHHNKIRRSRTQPRVVVLGSDPKILGTIAREFQWNPRDEEKDLERVRRGARHIVRTRNLANVVIFLQEVGSAMRDHGLGSKFSRDVRNILCAVLVTRFKDAVASGIIPELSQVP